MKNVREMMKIMKFPLIASLLSTSLMAQNDNSAMHNLVIATAESYVRENVSASPNSKIMISAKKIDKRINIPVCPLPLVVSTNNRFDQSSITTKVQCPSNHWFIYLSVKVEEVQPVVVPNTALSPGTILTKDNLDIVNINKNRLRSTTYHEPESLIGARLKRRSRPGQPISPSMLCFVCKGDNIIIVAQAGNMQIKTSGVAQQDGNIGDTIIVKNKRSKKHIGAKVVNIKQVEVQI